MGRLGLSAVALVAAGFVAASVLAANGPAAKCTATQKAQRSAAAAAYAKSIPAARARYFKSHKSASARVRFVKQERARLAALRSAASCTVPRPTTSIVTTTATTTTTPASPTISYDFGPGVDSGAQDTIRAYVDHAATDELALTGVAVQATAHASTDANWIGQSVCNGTGYPNSSCYTAVAAQFATGFTVAEGGSGALWLDWAAPDFQQTGPPNLQKIIAHELFHVIQSQLGMPNEVTVPIDQPRRGGPNWLVEGAAEYVGYRVTGDLGLQDYGTSLAQQKAVARGFSIPLDQLVTIQQSQVAGIYSLFEVAVDHLVAETSVGALVDYFKELGAGKAWPDAFSAAFGRSVDAYYADFAAYRATL